MKFLTFLCFLFGMISLIRTFSKRWTYDILDMSYYTSNPDILELEFSTERIGRGRFGYGGIFDLKRDMDDDLIISATLQRSKMREGPYRMTPFTIDNETLTNAMNSFYKRMVMPSLEKCSENSPIFKDKFVAPLTKRRVVLKKCELSTDGMPVVMMEDYYVLRISLFREDFEAYLEVLVYIENT